MNTAAFDAALQRHGLNDRQLAQSVGVSRQAVSKWRRGDFPRPAVLLRVAQLLSLSFSELVMAELPTPVVAFRKKAGTKTTEGHLMRGQRMGSLLRALVPHLKLPPREVTRIDQAQLDPASIDAVVALRRRAMGLDDDAAVMHLDLVGALADNGALLVPVHWGQRGRHENAMHIELPDARITFIYLNLDCRVDDILFWLAHELAHTLTPEMSGTEAGEDFADAFAAAFLMPTSVAMRIGQQVQGLSSAEQMSVVKKEAKRLGINLLTVYRRVNACANAHGMQPLLLAERAIHSSNAAHKDCTLAAALWPDRPPSAQEFVACMSESFRTDIFAAFGRMFQANQGDAGYLQQVLDIPRADAESMYAALIH